MTGARDVGGASVAARRLLVLAGAMAGFWLVSWLTSAHADAAQGVALPGLPDPIGVVVGAPAQGKGPAASPARPAAADERRAAGGTSKRSVADVATARLAADSAARATVARGDVSAGAVVGSVSRAVEAVVSPASGAAVVVEPVSRVVGSAEPVSRVAEVGIADTVHPHGSIHGWPTWLRPSGYGRAPPSRDQKIALSG